MIGTPLVDKGVILLTALQTAWLAQTSKENVRRWFKAELKGQPAGAACLPWPVVRDRVLARTGSSPLDPAWLWLHPGVAQPREMRDLCATVLGRLSDDVTEPARDREAELEAQVAALTRERNEAIADAEAIDIAAMSYRDSWRRRSDPNSPLPRS